MATKSNNQGVGPWQVTETDPYLINDVFRQIEEQINRLRGLGLPISIVVHAHTTNAQGGKLDHGAALTGLLDNDHPQYLLATTITTDQAVEDAQATASHITDELQVGTALTLTELADGSGDAVSVALADTVVTPGTYGDASNVAQVTVDQQGRLTAAVNVALPAPATIFTDQALYDATTAEHVGDDIFTDDTLTLTELADGSGDAIQLGIQPSLLVDQIPQDHISDQVMVDATLTLTEQADASGDAIALALANTAVTPGTYGSASNSAQITVDQQGRLTAASNVAISGATEAFDVGLVDANDYGTDPWETVVDGLADLQNSIDSTGRFQLQGQNRFLHLTSVVGVELSAVQSINDSTFTAVNWDVDTFDPDNMHNTTTNKSRLVANVAGKYLIGGGPTFSTFTGVQITEIWVNATTQYRVIEQTNIGFDPNRGIIVLSLAANDYIEFMAWQNSGGASNVYGDPTNSARSTAFMAYIGE